MNKQLFLLAVACICTTACQRTGREAWEDSKTCGRYVGKGVRSLFGQHDGGDYACLNRWSDEGEFEPLKKGGITAYTHELEMSDCAPPSRESPGDPGSPLPGIDGFAMPSGKLARLFANVHFETDQYVVSGDGNMRALHEIAQHLVAHPGTYVFVEGHADERGAAAYNLALGARRANSVRTFLIQNGVDPDQLFTISYGKERPLVQGHDNSSWKENRRAQFKLYERS